MENFTRKLITEWRRLNLPTDDGTFVVAVSGGADSVALTLALADLRKRGKLNPRFVVAHFNHDLRGAESFADCDFVRNLTTALNIEFVCKTQRAEEKIESEKGNLEQNARQARYEFLFETAENLNAKGVLTAHTLNDQAETFLINLMRGSGLDGLSGMRPIREFALQAEDENTDEQSSIALIRPLLNWAKREDTENFCHFKNIEFRFDAMNEDLKFNRVRVRKILLPLLTDFNPKIIETLAQTADLLRESAEQINSKLPYSTRNSDENRKPKTESRKTILNLKELTDIFPAMRRTILRDWLKTNRGSLRRLELKHIEAIENLIASRKSGRIVELPNGEKIVKSGGNLYFEKTKVEK